ncbi:MAG: hypothetical protein D6800_01940 [Candidatus Zixiibacteriota bacterium]|nr:MAG: hypothetical protein D6800_01940 [candidate division Zixibacteria bacterium]
MPGKKTPPQPCDLTRVSRYSIKKRKNKTEVKAFARPLEPDAAAHDFFNALPRFLKASDLREFITRVIAARRRGLPFHLLLGAHTIKVGLAPLFIDLMERELVTGLSFNGAGLIHDLELAFFGGTSEDVLSGLRDGSFGMVRETSELHAAVVALARREELGLGEAGGRFINEQKARHRRLSVFATAQRLGLPVTVHVGIGTDIVCQHPEYEGAAVGAASHRDFRILASICTRLDRGGVVANIGSTVILPEVFLKALTVARNIKRGKSRLTTANFDMYDHYRPRVNIVTRPTFQAGKGFSFIGHHELMIPLLAWGLKAAAADSKSFRK